MQRKPTQAGN